MFAEAAGIEETDAKESLLAIDKAKVDALMKKLAKGVPRPEHRMLTAQLDAVAD